MYCFTHISSSLGLPTPQNLATNLGFTSNQHCYINKNSKLEGLDKVKSKIFIYAYCFTHNLTSIRLPAPQIIAVSLGCLSKPGCYIDKYEAIRAEVFDVDRNIRSNIVVSHSEIYKFGASRDDARLIVFIFILLAFLLVYYLPFRYKQVSLILMTCLGISVLYGLKVFSLLFACHLLVYSVLHPERKQHLRFEASMGLLFCYGFIKDFSILSISWLVLAPLISINLFILLNKLLKKEVYANIIRLTVIQSAVIAIAIAVIIHGIAGAAWKIPVGLILFFWLWARVTLYYIDFKDGLVPEDVKFNQYLTVFFNPCLLPSWGWGAAVGQGYHYIHNSYFCEEKNTTVIRGIKLILFALCYLIFWDYLMLYLAEIARSSSLQIETYNSSTRFMIKALERGDPIPTSSVLMTTLFDLCRFFLYLASVIHFKVGVWNICGFKIAPELNKPWLATNLISFWTRFSYHYRLFLVRAFYYPVFFKYFKNYPQLRIFCATFAAAAIGNLIWHLGELALVGNPTFNDIQPRFATWGYYTLLAIGIAVCQLFLLKRKKRRKPWTKGPWLIADVIAMMLTIQYFALIHVFAKPTATSTFTDHMTLFLRGLGF